MNLSVRGPIEDERKAFEMAVAAKDKEALAHVVCVLYPQILWGSVTTKLSSLDKAWVLEVLRATDVNHYVPEDMLWGT